MLLNFIFQKNLVQEFNQIDWRFQLSRDYVDSLIRYGAKLCDHLVPVYNDPLNKNKKFRKSSRDYFKVIILGGSWKSGVNLSQLEVLKKYVFPKF